MKRHHTSTTLGVRELSPPASRREPRWEPSAPPTIGLHRHGTLSTTTSPHDPTPPRDDRVMSPLKELNGKRRDIYKKLRELQKNCELIWICTIITIM